jgi:Leucine-rich repeat (LRR) protein
MMADPDLPTPAPARDLPFADDLLSERSKAWVQERLHQGASSADPEPPREDGFQPRIDGYTLGERLGRGGMGTVYACVRDGSGDRLAIKLISSGRYAAEEERRRFRAEIGVLLRLHHPNLSRLRDFGQDGAVAWFVMDFIDGRQFSQWLTEDRPGFQVIAALLGHTARAVAHAHRQGIVHRDLNPANLMVLTDCSPVVMDFGLARDLSSDEVLTLTGTTVGTPPYMSPEQTLGSKGVITPLTDIWGLGSILYHGLTGRAPFEGDSNHEIFTAINDTDVTRPGSFVAGIPGDLERICLRCLQRNAYDRYQDMDTLAADLEAFAAGRPVGVRLPGPITRLRRRIRRRPVPWALALGLVVMAMGFACYAVFEEFRRWATWSTVEHVVFDHIGPLPPGLMARDGLLVALPTQPESTPEGLPAVEPVVGQAGWWWLERPGLQGGVRLDFEIDCPVNDAFEIVVNAAPERPREWWHHPAGWCIKVQSADVLSLAVAYRDRPGPLQTDNGFLLERGPSTNHRIRVVVEVRDTTCTVTVDGSRPVNVSEPLALGGSDHRAVAIRYFGQKTRLLSLAVDRLAAAELVSPLAGPDALLRHGHGEEAIAEYLLIADDHASSILAGQALLRAYGESCRQRGVSDEQRLVLYRELQARGLRSQLDAADRMRAISLWGQGQARLALGVARDLVVRRPDLNPVQAFLDERTWTVPEDAADEILDLFAQSPQIAGVSLAELGLQHLDRIAGRRAWTINISGNAVSDLSSLIGSGARSLQAARNRIVDLGPLAALPELGRLVLSDNQIADLGPLANLPVLATLDLRGNHIATARGIPDSVSDLNLSANPIQDLAGVPLRQLHRLAIASTGVVDLQPLAVATQLEVLDLSNTGVRTLAPLAGLPVNDVQVGGCRQVDLEGLDLPSLRRLIAPGIGLTDVTRLGRVLVGGLNILDLSGNPLSVWPALDAPELRDLQLARCPLAGVGGLSGLTALRRLDLRACGLQKVDGLSALRQLRRLDLRDNRLTGLGELLSEPPPVLLVQGNPLSADACQELIAAGQRLRRYDLVVQGASRLAQLRGDPGLLRGYAIPYHGRAYTTLLTSTPCDEATAKSLAAAAGARLAIIPDVEVQSQLAVGLEDVGAWIGVRLHAAHVVDDANADAPYIAAIPPRAYRGYRTVPTDGGRLALIDALSWGICPDGTAGGVVLEWDQTW